MALFADGEKETCEDMLKPAWLEVVPHEEESGDAELPGEDGASVSFSMARQPKTRIWTRRPRTAVMAVRRNMGGSREKRFALEYSTFLWMKKNTRQNGRVWKTGREGRVRASGA